MLTVLILATSLRNTQKIKTKKSNAFHNTHTKRTSVNSQITLHEEPFLYLSVFNTNDVLPGRGKH